MKKFFALAIATALAFPLCAATTNTNNTQSSGISNTGASEHGTNLIVHKNILIKKKLTLKGSNRMINPQPEPPKIKKRFLKPWEIKALDPQPEPPARANIVKNSLGAVSLNPQPEPPKPITINRNITVNSTSIK